MKETALVAGRVQRWIEVTPSQFSHEAEGLNLVRFLLPTKTPFRAWSTFEFRDGLGMWHEVDLLVLGQRRLHLVELKYYAGDLRGDDLMWRRDGRRAEDSPLKLARRKAQRLAGRLQDELIRWAHETGTDVSDPRKIVPFVKESVFLHHPGIRCLLPPVSRTDLFGLDGGESDSRLEGISKRLLESATRQRSVDANDEKIVAELMARIGAVQHRQREAGSWVIDEEPLGEGDGWQDWPAFHRVAKAERARIRFLITPPGATAATQDRVRRVAEHEYRIMSRLANDQLLRPRDIIQNDLGVGLVYALDDRFQRLDLWLADQAGKITDTGRLSLLRQVAEAVAYAHRNQVVHRGLTPHAVLVRLLSYDEMRILVGDWRSAGTVAGAELTGLPGSGVTGLMGTPQTDGQAGNRPSGIIPLGAVDVDRQMAEVFQAPEGVWNRDADRVRLDVFALGALAYFVLSGRSAASDQAGLRERLYRDGGLDLAADLPQAPPAVQALVLEATRPAVSDRLPDVRSFLERLAVAEQELAAPVKDVVDPLEASPGAVIDGRFRLERRLGAGSTAVGLLVTDLTVTDPGAETIRVLKVAVDDAAARRLAAEARVLARLDGPRLVRFVAGPVQVGGRPALVLESAGEETLGEVLHRVERVPLPVLQRWGTDLLEVLIALRAVRVHHRDIKPANLGIREDRDDRLTHLVLFDFSLAGAGTAAVTVGTPPYLDPFLGRPERGRFDSAAERYAAGVVLFEMATGRAPRFGDGLSDPAFVHDEATIEAQMFDPTVADALATFFRAALARNVRQRHRSADDMLSAWQAVFAPLPGSTLGDAGERAIGARPSAPRLVPAAKGTPPSAEGWPPGPAADAFPTGLYGFAEAAAHADAAAYADQAVRLLTDAEQVARTIDPAGSGVRKAGFVREGALVDVARVVARVDPAYAEQIARSLAADRSAALASIAGVVAATDAAQAAKLLGDAQQHFKETAQQDFRWRFPEVQLVRRQIMRAVDNRFTLATVAGALARSDLAAAARLLEGAHEVAVLDDDVRDELLAGIAAAAAGVDPARAEQFAASITTDARRAEALGWIASALAGVDRDHAARLLAQAADAACRAGSGYALVAVARAAARDDRALARQLLAEAQQIARGEPGQTSLAGLAGATAVLDPARAEEIARGIAHEQERAEALAGVAVEVARADPLRAEEVARSITGAYERSRVLSHIAAAVAGADPHHAAHLVAEAEQVARGISDRMLWRPEGLVQVARAAATADPARAESIARGLIDEGPNPPADGPSWAVRALVAVADVWLGPPT